MADKARAQLNIRLDKEPELLDKIKEAAAAREMTATDFVLDAIRQALGASKAVEPHSSMDLGTILSAVESKLDEMLDKKLEERLGE